jgi:hypothetical protein
LRGLLVTTKLLLWIGDVVLPHRELQAVLAAES